MISQRVILTSLATVGAFGVAVYFATREPNETVPLPSSDVAYGASLYAENCASCHGPNLEGAKDWREYNPDGKLNPPPHDATGHTWHHTDTQIFTCTKFGGAGAMAEAGVENFNSGMPAFDGLLTDEEIWEVLDFNKSTWPKKIRDAQAEMSRLNSN